MLAATALEQLGLSASALIARSLREHPEASALICAETDPVGREHLLIPAAAAAWKELRRAAAGDGVTFFIVSAFRSIERQLEIVRRKLCAGSTLADVLTVCAPPGFSEHHTGCAVDIGTVNCPPLEPRFGETPAFRWLEQRAAEFGYTLSYPAANNQGYAYEPWHWCFGNALPGVAADAPALGRRR